MKGNQTVKVPMISQTVMKHSLRIILSIYTERALPSLFRSIDFYGFFFFFFCCCCFFFFVFCFFLWVVGEVGGYHQYLWLNCY